MQTGLVSIIIVTRNSATTLPACMASIRNQSYSEFETIVVDNGSTDDTLELLDSHPVIRIVNSHNLGFAKANNQALAASKGEYILFLNSDATIEPNFLALAIPYFRNDESLGAIAGKILRPSNNDVKIIDSAGLLMEHWRLLPRDRGEGERDNGQYDTATYVFGCPGACAFYRRAALEIVALGQEVMDEDFFAYYEDVDLAWRVRRENWTALFVPGAIAYHHKRGPRGKELPIQVKAFTNRYWCYLKNEQAARFLFYAPIAILYEIARTLKILSLNPRWIPLYLKEFRLFSKMTKKRRATLN